MILKTYSFSKMYYRKIILQNKLVSKHRTLESYFLEWKLYYAENVHNRLLENDIVALRRKLALKKMKHNTDKYSVTNKIIEKKKSTLIKLKSSLYFEDFFINLRRNWNIRKGKSKLSSAQLEQKGK